MCIVLGPEVEPGAGNPPRCILLDEAIEEASWAYPEPEQPGLLRIVPMEKPGEREVRGEPDPYNPLHFPSYSYWPQGVEAAE